MVIFVLEHSCAHSARCSSDWQQDSYCNRCLLSVRQFHMPVGLELHIMFGEDLEESFVLIEIQEGRR